MKTYRFVTFLAALAVTVVIASAVLSSMFDVPGAHGVFAIEKHHIASDLASPHAPP